MPKHFSDIPFSSARLAFSIGAAEAVSSLVSLGSVLIAMRHEQALKPVTDWASRQLGSEERGKLAVNGGIMLSTGFLSHLPLELMIDQRLTLQDLKAAGINKAIGITSALATIAIAEYLIPETMDKMEKKLTKIISSANLGSASGPKADEFARLLAIEVPSSIIAGFINYRCHRL